MESAVVNIEGVIVIEDVAGFGRQIDMLQSVFYVFAWGVEAVGEVEKLDWRRVDEQVGVDSIPDFAWEGGKAWGVVLAIWEGYVCGHYQSGWANALRRKSDISEQSRCGCGAGSSSLCVRR